jgi:hypothetical protein
MMPRQIHLRPNGYGAMNGIAESNVHLALTRATAIVSPAIGRNPEIGERRALLWLAEAAKVSRRDVLAAKRSALAARRSRGTHCAVIRKAIPLPVIEERLVTFE